MRVTVERALMDVYSSIAVGVKATQDLKLRLAKLMQRDAYQCFKLLDGHQRGFITCYDVHSFLWYFCHLIVLCSEHQAIATEVECNTLIRHFDSYKIGKLNYVEYLPLPPLVSTKCSCLPFTRA